MSFVHLFTPYNIRGVEFRNRIFSSAHQTILAENWCPTDEMAAYHEARAAGGAGLIIIEAARPHCDAVTSSSYIDVSRDECIPGYQKISDAVHRHGCRVFGQIAHGGRIAQGYGGLLGVPYAPSTVPDHRFHTMPRNMSTDYVWEVIKSHADAALRMAEGGLDGIEITASHGLLLAQFLSPDVNRRDDEFGGSEEKRFRFVQEVIAAVRKAIGPERILGIRISAAEDEPTGLDQQKILNICRKINDLEDCDYLNVTMGSMAGLGSSVHVVPPMSFKHAYTASHAASIRDVFSRSIFVTGRINQPQIAEQILDKNQADMCGMTRAMIADADMPNKALKGKLDDIRSCIGCNQACIGHYHKGVPISCIQDPVSGRELKLSKRTKTENPKKILIAGGGPGGMKAAAVAAEKGHQVVLCEKSDQLGGQVLLAQMLPDRGEFGVLVENLKREMDLWGVEVRLLTNVDNALVYAEKPDDIIIATGAEPFQSDAEISKETHTVEAWSVIQNNENTGNSVVIADWRCDYIGMGVAEMLAKDGCDVRLAVDGTHAGQNLQIYLRDNWIGKLHNLGVKVIPYARLYGADADTAYFYHTAGGSPILCEGMDTLVLAQGHQPVTSLEDSLIGSNHRIHLVGDCLSPRSTEEAIYEGFMTAREV